MKNRRIIIIVGAVIILAAIGGGAYLFLSTRQSNNAVSSYEVAEGSVTERINITGEVKTFQGVDLSIT
jgi:flagellar basal body-associated protein FliL